MKYVVAGGMATLSAVVLLISFNTGSGVKEASTDDTTLTSNQVAAGSHVVAGVMDEPEPTVTTTALPAPEPTTVTETAKPAPTVTKVVEKPEVTKTVEKPAPTVTQTIIVKPEVEEKWPGGGYPERKPYKP